METLSHQKIEAHLFREVKKHEAILNAEYITLFNASMNGNNAGLLRKNSNASGSKNQLVSATTLRKPVETIALPVAYDESTSAYSNKARLLNGLVSPCYTNIFKTHLVNGEISLAVVNGQVRNVVYESHNASGFMWKNIVLKKPYPHDVEIKVITEIQLPSNKSGVYKMEPGTINLASIGLRGNIFNFINYRYDPGHSTSAGHWTPFLRSLKLQGRIIEDRYENRITDSVSLMLPRGIKEFTIGSIGSVTAVSTFDADNPSLWPQNYGYGYVDLRSKLDANLPVILEPLANEYKSPPGGIQLSVKLEISRLQES